MDNLIAGSKKRWIDAEGNEYDIPLEYTKEAQEAGYQLKGAGVAAAIHGAGQGASLGFSDEMLAGMAALGDPEYKQSRDFVRAFEKQLSKQYPVTTALSTIGGGIAGMAALPGATLAKGAATVAPRLVAGARALPGIAKGALSGAGWGAGAGLGTSEAELGTAQSAKDVGMGSAFGTLLGTAGATIPPGIKAGAKKLGGYLKGKVLPYTEKLPLGGTVGSFRKLGEIKNDIEAVLKIHSKEAKEQMPSAENIQKAYDKISGKISKEIEGNKTTANAERIVNDFYDRVKDSPIAKEAAEEFKTINKQPLINASPQSLLDFYNKTADIIAPIYTAVSSGRAPKETARLLAYKTLHDAIKDELSRMTPKAAQLYHDIHVLHEAQPYAKEAYQGLIGTRAYPGQTGFNIPLRKQTVGSAAWKVGRLLEKVSTSPEERQKVIMDYLSRRKSATTPKEPPAAPPIGPSGGEPPPPPEPISPYETGTEPPIEPFPGDEPIDINKALGKKPPPEEPMAAASPPPEPLPVPPATPRQKVSEYILKKKKDASIKEMEKKSKGIANQLLRMEGKDLSQSEVKEYNRLLNELAFFDEEAAKHFTPKEITAETKRFTPKEERGFIKAQKDPLKFELNEINKKISPFEKYLVEGELPEAGLGRTKRKGAAGEIELKGDQKLLELARESGLVGRSQEMEGDEIRRIVNGMLRDKKNIKDQLNPPSFKGKKDQMRIEEVSALGAERPTVDMGKYKGMAGEDIKKAALAELKGFKSPVKQTSGKPIEPPPVTPEEQATLEKAFGMKMVNLPEEKMRPSAKTLEPAISDVIAPASVKKPPAPGKLTDEEIKEVVRSIPKKQISEDVPFEDVDPFAEPEKFQAQFLPSAKERPTPTIEKGLLPPEQESKLQELIDMTEALKKRRKGIIGDKKIDIDPFKGANVLPPLAMAGAAAAPGSDEEKAQRMAALSPLFGKMGRGAKFSLGAALSPRVLSTVVAPKMRIEDVGKEEVWYVMENESGEQVNVPNSRRMEYIRNGYREVEELRRGNE